MRPRIRKTPKLVASTTNDTDIQELCAFNRKQAYKAKTTIGYILTCWGKSKSISKSEYDLFISKGLSNFVKKIEE